MLPISSAKISEHMSEQLHPQISIQPQNTPTPCNIPSPHHASLNSTALPLLHRSLILRITLINIRDNLPLPPPRAETVTRNSTKQFLPSISTMKFILRTLSPSMRTLTLFAADMALRPIFTAAKRYLQLTPARHQPQTSKEQANKSSHCRNTQRQ